MMEFAARKLDRGFVLASSSPQRGEGGPQGRMRGAEGHLCLAPASPKPPSSPRIRSALLPAGEKWDLDAFALDRKNESARRQANRGHGGVTRSDLATPQRNILYVH